MKPLPSYETERVWSAREGSASSAWLAWLAWLASLAWLAGKQGVHVVWWGEMRWFRHVPCRTLR
jgi:hypothetical protein